MHNGSAEIKFDPEGWWGFSIQGHVFPGWSVKVSNGHSPWCLSIRYCSSLGRQVRQQGADLQM